MAKNNYFVLEFKLNTQIYQEHILAKRFRIAELIYNNVLSFANEQLFQMRRNKTYKHTLNQYFYYKDLNDNKNIKLYSDLLKAN